MYDSLQQEVDDYRKVLADYRALYEEDGTISSEEQAHLDALEKKISQVAEALGSNYESNGNGYASGNGSASSAPIPSTGASSSATTRVVPGAGGYEYEQHADGSIFIVKSPVNGVTRIQVQEGTTAYNAILAEIGPFPSSGGQPGTAPPEVPDEEPVESAPVDPGHPKAPGGDAAWDVQKAVQHLKANAEPAPVGKCGTYTREAIEAGGVTLRRANLAKDYGPSLLEVGFETVSTASYQAGDVVIMQNCPGHDAGHMQMYSGSQWISDYVQRDFWPYTSSRPQYAVYRFPLSGGNGGR